MKEKAARFLSLLFISYFVGFIIISLIQTKKGKRFGGFTKVDWTDENGRKNDPNAFLFSLDNKCEYKILKSNLAFSFYSSYPLVYGNNSMEKGFTLIIIF